MDHSATGVSTVDYHTAGEPFRIVPAPPLDIPGDTVAEKRMTAIASAEIDGLRRFLCWEPRGHADMYGGFITEPDDEGAHFGVLFWHKDGFSTACGHGTIALGIWAVRTGIVAVDPSGTTDVIIDVPSGRVTARVRTDADGRVTSADFVNVPSTLIAEAVPVETSLGSVTVDLAWGGAIYACLDVATLGGRLSVTPENLPTFIALGREVKAALAEDRRTEHPGDPRLSGVYGTIVHESLDSHAGAGAEALGDLHQRNVTIFADGQVDRSPCGSGTSARVGALWAQGHLSAGQTLIHDSIVGTRFRARVLAEDHALGRAAVVPVVTGTAHEVARSTFTLDPDDTLVPGFVLR
ncbi:proline racemase/trans-L-3-hydroxyproline dehydratase [Brevibacterium sanguinis]|uniref:Proline racemase/trans-L-3-hydroxyproline dehydratase n=2 Tax=Brevibacterium TaxID=1696 RepID=A0A366ILV3_9MICO|nr:MULTISPECIES: proline racemase family protein [Brevibacterium]RBP67182.1 proline racemase/trans-L-3-hydroxyproline dehydratase [Brevibacterium sanguinis]RBP73707.1 proline racemase/trans-L-3-hydroxyproline dehydratase [Brevibacterium celere]